MYHQLNVWSPRFILILSSFLFLSHPTLSQTRNILYSSFANHVDITTDLHPNGLVLVDLDGDGKLDFATPNNYSTTGSPASVSVVRNIGTRGAPSFAPAINLPTGQETYCLAAGDVNGDGKPDLVSGSYVDNTISIFINTSSVGSIAFASKTDLSIGYTPSWIAVSDIDGDGKRDILVTNGTGAILSVFRNTSSGNTVSFAPRADYATGAGPNCIAIGDLDGDGKPDVAVANNLSTTVTLYRNTSSPGSVSFAQRQDLSTTTGTDNPFGIAIVDIDGDGKPDMVVSNNNITSVNQSINTFSVFRNTSSSGNFSFASPLNYSTTMGYGDGYHIAAGDLNGDGKPDLVIGSRSAEGNLLVWQNTSSPGSVSLAPQVDFYALSPYAPAIGDIDGDGNPDMLVANFAHSSVSLYRSRIDEPTIFGVNPITAGPDSTVTLTGMNFTGATSVTFDGIPAASFTVASDTKITAVLGNGAYGDITVTNAKGYGSFTGFQFAGPPLMTSFSPSTAGSGMILTVVGHNFNTTQSVTLGGSVANFTVVTPDTLDVQVGGGSSGAVAVTTTYGTTSLPGFTWIALPAIQYFSPTNAGTGIMVTITGKNFSGATAVSFGGVPAASFTVVNNTTIQATPAAGASGSISVTTPNGTASLAGFVFQPAPTITGYSPSYGVNGTVLTLTGNNLTNITGLTVGGVNYSGSYSSVSPQTITITLNDQTTSGDIVLTTTGGTVTVHGFVFYHTPAVYSISPSIAGSGMTVNISGVNLDGATSVTLGGIPVGGFTVNSSTSIAAVVGNGGTGNVVVTNPAGSNFMAPKFTFTNSPVITAASPDSGAPGTLVTINGGNFTSDDVVWFGGASAPPVSVTPEQITVKVPAAAGYGSIGITSPSNKQSGYLDQPYRITFPGDPRAFDAGSFAGHREFATGARPWDVAAGDLDGDGKLDIAVANFFSGSVSVFLNTSTGPDISFAPKIDLAAALGVKNISLADIDCDGRLDIIVSVGGDNVCSYCNGSGIYVFRNTGSKGKPGFDNPVYIPVSNGEMDYMAVGDLDHDGKPDIAGANAIVGAGNAFSFFQNTSTAGVISFAETDGYTLNYPNSGSTAAGIALRDMNGDGYPEVLYGQDGGDHLVLEKNAGIFGFMGLAPVDLGTGNYQMYDRTYPLVADFNADGLPDIITGGSLERNNGKFAFTNIPFANTGGAGAVADLNGDGYPDIVRTGFLIRDSLLYLYKDSLAAGAIPFAARQQYAAPYSERRVIIGDIDGDGKPDIISANRDLNTFSIFRNRIGEDSLQTPAITSFTPGTGGYGTKLTISGSHLDQTTSVTVGGTPASAFTVISDSSIIAIVDNGTTGAVTVSTPGGTAALDTFTYFFSPLPQIASFGPTTAKAGSSVTIMGANFTGATGVSFGSVAARSFTVISPTVIVAIVDSAISDSIAVTNAAGSASVDGFVFVATPVITPSGTTALCAGDTLVLQTKPQDSIGQYQWYNNGAIMITATTDSLVTDSPGRYSVRVTINGVSSPMSAMQLVTVNPLPATPDITQMGDSLISTADTGNQWYVDTTTTIAGATGKIFVPSTGGSYSVRASQNGCWSPLSPPFAFVGAAGNLIRIAPNPASDFITINFNIPGITFVYLEIVNVNGGQVLAIPVVRNGDRVDMASLARGMYFVRALSPGGQVLSVVKIYKL